MMMSLLQLPQSIWREKIVFFFDKVHDLVRLDSAVQNKSDREDFLSSISGCKRFYQFKEKTEGSIRWFVLRNIVVKAADFSAEIQSEDAPYMQRLLTQVRSIAFLKNSVSQHSGIQLQGVWLSSTALIDLNFVSCEIEVLSTLSVCVNLRNLELTECAHASTESFVVAVKGCVNLTCVALQDCAKLCTEAAIALLQSCVSLTSVRLSGPFDLTKVLAEISQPTSIRTFFCRDDQDSTLLGSVFRSITSVMPQIKVLHLHYWNNTATDSDVEVLVSNLTQLTDILLCSCPDISDTALVCIAQTLPCLRCLYIDYCQAITDAGVIALARSATNLRTLRLTDLFITDAAIQAVGTHCTLLNNLDVGYCSFLTDAAFTTLDVSKLWRVDVSGTRVTGTFAARVFSDASLLFHFVAVDCDLLSADFVHSLPALYTKSISLSLGSANRLTESDWLQLPTKFHNLCSLCITDNTVVNDAIAQSFKAHCPKLRNVILKGCNVSEEVLKLFG